MSRPSAAAALRESFGDRRPPEISRKITACVSCRKLKVKCNVATSGAPCARCKTRGLSCTVNKSLQMLLEDDASWKERIEQRIEALEQAQQPARHVEGAAATIGTTAPVHITSSSGGSHTSDPSHAVRTGSVPMSEANDATLNLASNLGIFPATSVGPGFSSDVALPTLDIISQGVISLAAAESCLTYFLEHLNRYLHGILSKQATLSDLRARSSILTAAVCTVASFCSASDIYQSCYNAFVGRVSSMLFATRNNYDDVRALCIAALWLDDIAPTLSGLAVRIGSQLDLHRCITKMPHKNILCYDRTRLFYMLCLCDHHCTLKYGRPPMTQEWRSLKNPTTFLDSEFSRHPDLSLISQLELWTTTRTVFEQFGADVESSAASEKLDEMDKLGEAYQTWHTTWSGVLGEGYLTGSITELYFNSALLYLYSHIHRGEDRSPNMNTGSKIAELRHHFRRSAQAVLRIFTAGELRVSDLPSYFGTMLAFATVSLIKVVRDAQVLDEDRHDILCLLRQLADTFRQIKLPPSKSHPYVGIAKSLEQATETLHGNADQPVVAPGGLAFDDSILMDDIWNMDFTDFGGNWMMFSDH